MKDLIQFKLEQLIKPGRTDLKEVTKFICHLVKDTPGTLTLIKAEMITDAQKKLTSHHNSETALSSKLGDLQALNITQVINEL